MLYVLADRDGSTVKNTYSGMDQSAVITVLAGIGCMNIRFVSRDEWEQVA